MTNVYGYDATHEGLPTVPAGAQVAGYDTGTDGTNGTPNIVWTTADFAAHPGAIHIDQSPVLDQIDEESDVLDVENGAATNAECAQWYTAALANYQAGARPGQRYPCIYTSLSNVTPLVNQLIADGVTSGPRLWVAHWGITPAEAEGLLNTSGGPFPIVGVQYNDGAALGTPAYDYDVWRSDWLSAVSGGIPANDLPTYFSKTEYTVARLGWGDSDNAPPGTDYHIQIADMAGNTVVDERIVGNNYQSPLLTKGSYQWRIATGANASPPRLASPWTPLMP